MKPICLATSSAVKIAAKWEGELVASEVSSPEGAGPDMTPFRKLSMLPRRLLMPAASVAFSEYPALAFVHFS